MGVIFKHRPHVKDETTSSLVRHGVYHLADTYDDEEAKKFTAPAPYGFWSAAKYTFTLSLLLWWLPVFGQMIAGFVGGRRAGSPWKGMLAALIPVIAFAIVSVLVRAGIIPTVWFGIDMNPSAVVAALSAHIPLIQPYIVFVSLYLHNFFSSLASTGAMGMDSYITTVAFAYIGGVLSQQTRKELELIAKLSGGPRTTVVLEGNTFTQAPSPHHIEEVKKRGFGFDDLRSIGGESDGREARPLRSASRAMVEEPEAEEEKPQDRRALKARAQTMAHDQREVERKVHKKVVEEGEKAPRTGETKKDGRDWEFI
jgi:hypothetical protein